MLGRSSKLHSWASLVGITAVPTLLVNAVWWLSLKNVHNVIGMQVKNTPNTEISVIRKHIL